MLRKLLLIGTIALITACLRQPVSEPMGEVNIAARLIAQSPTVTELTSGMFREGLYNGEIIAEKGTAIVNVDIMESPQIYQMYLNYCNAWGGTLERPYVPDGFSATAASGFREQMVFFHKSRAGRPEFEFCTVNRTPIFAVTAAGRSSYYPLEGDALVKYIDQPKKTLVSIA